MMQPSKTPTVAETKSAKRREAASAPKPVAADPDGIDEASQESFPASNAPSWTTTTATRRGQAG